MLRSKEAPEMGLNKTDPGTYGEEERSQRDSLRLEMSLGGDSPTIDLSPRTEEPNSNHSLLTGAGSYDSMPAGSFHLLNATTNSLNKPTGATPLCNSTPLKKDAPVSYHIHMKRTMDGSEVNDLDYDPRNRSVLDKTTGKALKTSTVDGTHQSLAKSSSSTNSAKIMKHILTGVLFSVILFSVVIAVMESKDKQIRNYIHAVPGMETFRHIYYEPSKAYVLGVYQRLLAGRFRN